MKLKKIRTCNGCKAYISDKCELRFKTKLVDRKFGVYFGMVPLEKCFKPLTNDAYVKAYEMIRAGMTK
jgi:hypothetical protein